MSLINQMLKDLESRRPPENPDAKVILEAFLPGTDPESSQQNVLGGDAVPPAQNPDDAAAMPASSPTPYGVPSYPTYNGGQPAPYPPPQGNMPPQPQGYPPGYNPPPQQGYGATPAQHPPAANMGTGGLY